MTSVGSRLAAVGLALLLVDTNQVQAAERDTLEGSQGGRDIQGFTQGSADLVVPPRRPEGLSCRFGMAFPFQVAPKLVALSCSLRNENLPAGDGSFRGEGTNISPLAKGYL